MSLADKLQNILDTKNEIKEIIKNNGGDITDSTPFDEYPSKLLNIKVSDSKLKDLLNNTLLSINKTDLQGVNKLKNYAFYSSSLESAELSNSITEIGSNAFAYNSALKFFKNSETLEKIGSNAFSNCSGLASIIIPLSVEKIESRAFYSCKNLTIYCEAESQPSGWDANWNAIDYSGNLIPVVWGFGNISETLNGIKYALLESTLSAVAVSVTEDFSELSSVIIPKSIIKNNIEYEIKKIPKGILLNNTVLTKLEVPFLGDSKETSAHLGAFWGSTDNIPKSLKEVTVTNTSTIPDFRSCKKLTKISVHGNGSTKFNLGKIYGCNNLIDLTIGNGITEIIANTELTSTGSEPMFPKQISINSITLGKDITTIAKGSFSNSPESLTELNYLGSINQYAQINFANYSANPLVYASNIYIGNELVTTPLITVNINSDAFRHCDSFIELTIGEGCETIGNRAFYNCSNLQKVNIGNTVKTIGTEVFRDCKNLNTLEFGESLESFGDWAFQDCVSLNHVILPDSLTTLGYYGFKGAPLKTMVIGSGTKVIGSYLLDDKLEALFYKGSETDWASITIKTGNSNLTNSPRYYYSETNTGVLNKYWHYVDGIPTIWN